MIRKQIRRRRELIDAELRKLELQAKRLQDKRRDLQRQCAHSSRSESREFVDYKGRIQQCNDCGVQFFYTECLLY